MKAALLLLLLTILNLDSKAQSPLVYKWVNTPNLNLREFPEDNSTVYVVLHAPAKVRVTDPPSDLYYAKKKPF